MPDTGAPWNIPYVTSTDLVSGWPADSLALANAIDAGLDAAGPAGIGSNVVSVTKTDTFSTASTSFVDVTDLSVTITPSNATSKILVLATIHTSSSANAGNMNVRLLRGATDLAIGDAAGNRTRATTGYYGTNGGTDYAGMRSLGVNFLDSPTTTSATTYKIQISAGSTFTAYVNRSGRDTDDANHRRLVSSITAIEVAA